MARDSTESNISIYHDLLLLLECLILNGALDLRRGKTISRQLQFRNVYPEAFEEYTEYMLLLNLH